VQNPQTVDLLVSLAYVSAGEGAMDEPLPIGMGLRVSLPEVDAPPVRTTPSYPVFLPIQPPPVIEVPKDLQPGLDGLVDFDDLTKAQVPFSIDPISTCIHLIF
jgi:ubiquitin-conjugating enzyme E2 Q